MSLSDLTSRRRRRSLTLARYILPCAALIAAFAARDATAAVPETLQPSTRLPLSGNRSAPDSGRITEQAKAPHDLTQLTLQLNQLLSDAAAALRRRVEQGPPFLLQERLGRLDRLAALLAERDTALAEKYRQVVDAYRIELDYGRTIDAYRGTLRDGENRLVDFLGIGRLALYYQTLDGAESGIWLNGHRGWQRLSKEDNEKITEGLRAARKLIPPGLVVVPLPGPGGK